MEEVEAWVQAPENTLDSLRHGIVHFDGIEFDIRVTADRQLVVHHDRDVSVPKVHLSDKSPWVEEWTLDDLVGLGFLAFDDLLDDAEVQRQWVEKGKMGCIEIKRPHPKATPGGGYFGRQRHNEHIALAMRLAEDALEQRAIPVENTVFYAFHKGMPESAALAGTSRPWAALIPYIPPYGNRTTQRLQAFPQYLTTPFRRLVRRHEQQGSSMLPCAVEYFHSRTRHLSLGRAVGLRNGGRQRLDRHRNGMATYVWPTRPQIEHDLLRAGLTGLTDHADPTLTWLPSGHPRWNQPGTRPLDDDQWNRLASAEHDDHQTILAELQNETPTWAEADVARRRQLVEEWRSAWSWSGSLESVLASANGTTPPWSAPRLIGHRGSGKTSRPVLHPHSR